MAHAARYSVIFTGGAAPSLSDTKTLTVPNGTTILSTLAAARGMITHLRVVAATIFGVAHGTTSAAGDFVDKMVAQEDKIKQAMERDACHSRKLPVLILKWYHIHWMDWVQNQYASAASIAVPAFKAL